MIFRNVIRTHRKDVYPVYTGCKALSPLIFGAIHRYRTKTDPTGPAVQLCAVLRLQGCRYRCLSRTDPPSDLPSADPRTRSPELSPVLSEYPSGYALPNSHLTAVLSYPLLLLSSCCSTWILVNHIITRKISLYNVLFFTEI